MTAANCIISPYKNLFNEPTTPNIEGQSPIAHTCKRIVVAYYWFASAQPGQCDRSDRSLTIYVCSDELLRAFAAAAAHAIRRRLCPSRAFAIAAAAVCHDDGAIHWSIVRCPHITRSRRIR